MRPLNAIFLDFNIMVEFTRELNITLTLTEAEAAILYHDINPLPLAPSVVTGVDTPAPSSEVIETLIAALGYTPTIDDDDIPF